MDIGLQTVITPYENPTQFTPEWRHSLAKVVRDNPEYILPYSLRDDHYIMEQTGYLTVMGSSEVGLFCDFGMDVEHLAFTIFDETNGTTIKRYLEPLLLTEQPFDIIAKDLGISENVVRYYERVYWACRNDDELTHPSELLRSTFAMEGQINVPSNAPSELLWRVMGATLGYTALAYIWRWQKPAGKLNNLSAMSKMLTQANMGKLFELSLTGSLEAIDITSYLGQHINYERMKHDTNKGGTKNEYAEIVCGLMQIMAPQMSAFAQTGEALRRYEEGAQKVHAAEQAITDVEVEDAGALEARVTVNDKLQQALSPLAKRHQESNDD